MMMKRWAQNPPSHAKIKLVFGIVAFCLLLAGIEAVWGWPDWLTPERVNARR
ncbi:hypothetical protein SAMN05444714_1164 [Yoonia litorea]|uniref:Uncharacterized protein n=1 Tax=Yoonia litorea TaxID=1123755 RepID=A0A1I6M2Q6_9RHOB|nr:hypothetical protein SAMN05444714_1164 [Yoonia litorea]